MKTLLRRSNGAGVGDTVVVATERDDGDFHLRRTDPDVLARRQRAATGRRWVMVDQVHGVDVHAVDDAGPDGRPAAATAAGAVRADVVVGPDASVPIAVWAADCAPLVLLGRCGTVAAAHAGWRGLAAGVVDVAVRQVTDRGDTVVASVLGPVIHPCCYPFGGAELDRVAAGLDVSAAELAGTTSRGVRALDVPAAIAVALARHGVALDVVGPCTGCDRRWFSHRRGDRDRHAVVVWRTDGGPGP